MSPSQGLGPRAPRFWGYPLEPTSFEVNDQIRRDGNTGNEVCFRESVTPLSEGPKGRRPSAPQFLILD